jgi:hypothetical protein
MTFDQQSSTGGFFEGVINIQSAQPVGQSFTPSLNAIGFVQLALEGINSGNNENAVIYVNLLEGSITGQIIGQTTPATVDIGFEGDVNFYFSTAVAVSPGTTYYLQPVVQNGDADINASIYYAYSGGTLFTNGTPVPSENLYFREGIVETPEPSVWALMALAGGALFLRRCKAA